MGCCRAVVRNQGAAGFCSDVGYQRDGYFDVLVRMFEQALAQLSASDRHALIARSGEMEG